MTAYALKSASYDLIVEAVKDFIGDSVCIGDERFTSCPQELLQVQ